MFVIAFNTTLTYMHFQQNPWKHMKTMSNSIKRMCLSLFISMENPFSTKSRIVNAASGISFVYVGHSSKDEGCLLWHEVSCTQR